MLPVCHVCCVTPSLIKGHVYLNEIVDDPKRNCILRVTAFVGAIFLKLLTLPLVLVGYLTCSKRLISDYIESAGKEIESKLKTESAGKEIESKLKTESACEGITSIIKTVPITTRDGDKQLLDLIDALFTHQMPSSKKDVNLRLMSFKLQGSPSHLFLFHIPKPAHTFICIDNSWTLQPHTKRVQDVIVDVFKKELRPDSIIEFGGIAFGDTLKTLSGLYVARCTNSTENWQLVIKNIYSDSVPGALTSSDPFMYSLNAKMKEIQSLKSISGIPFGSYAA